jgi:RHS repeat-associated protein
MMRRPHSPKIITNALGHQTTTQYYGVDGVAADTGLYGEVKSVTDPNGAVTTTTYDQFGRKSQVTHPNGLVRTFNYPCVTSTGCTPDATNLFGNVGAQYVKESGGGLSSWTYFDGLGRTISAQTTGPGASIVRVDTDYNNLGQLFHKSLPYFFGGSSNGSVTYAYDAIGRVQQITHPDTSRSLFCYSLWSTATIDAGNHMKRESKDAYGRLLQVDEYTGTQSVCPSTYPAPYATTTYQYDVLGNLRFVTDAKGNQSEMRYDTLSRKTFMHDPDMGDWTYYYDGVGNLLLQADFTNQLVTQFSYDKLNRVKTRTTPTDSKMTIYSYDDPAAGQYWIGRLWQMTDPSGATTFFYDQSGRQTQVDKRIATSGLANVVLNAGFENGATWPYNWTKSQQSGASVTFTWDTAIKRSGAKSASIANPTGWATILGNRVPYDPDKSYTAKAWIKTSNLSAATARVRLRFEDAAGNSIGLINSPAMGGTVDWTQQSVSVASAGAPAGTAYVRAVMLMDAASGTAWFDDVRLEDGSLAGTTYTTRYAYDTLNRVTALTYPDNSIVNNAYNGPLLDRVYEGATNYAQYAGYNALGQPGTVTHGNGVVTTYTYSNPANTTCPQQNFRTCTIAIGSFQTLTYGYDNGQAGVGNITSVANTANGNQTFAYDALNRLTSATGPYGALTYAYDQIGNMICNSQLSACSQSSPNYTYPASGPNSIRPHAVSTAGSDSYVYDDYGNMISGGGRDIVYDPEHRPVSITAASGATSFVYDGNGKRVKKIVGSSTTVYIGNLYECTGSACSKYIFAGDQRIALKSVGTTDVRYFHTDHLGSSSVVTDQAGALYQNLAYYPYGETRVNSLAPAAGVFYKYTGQMLDDSTGLYFYGARYYDPKVGRFISADSIVQSMRNPQFLNRYSYVMNNPIKLIDPSGHVATCGVWGSACSNSGVNNPCGNGNCGPTPPSNSISQNRASGTGGQGCPPGGCFGAPGTSEGLGFGSSRQVGIIPVPVVSNGTQEIVPILIAVSSPGSVPPMSELSTAVSSFINTEEMEFHKTCVEGYERSSKMDPPR